MRRITWDPILVVLYLAIAGCIVGAIVSAYTWTQYQQACEKLGGVPYQAKNARVCLNPNAVL